MNKPIKRLVTAAAIVGVLALTACSNTPENDPNAIPTDGPNAIYDGDTTERTKGASHYWDGPLSENLPADFKEETADFTMNPVSQKEGLDQIEQLDGVVKALDLRHHVWMSQFPNSPFKFVEAAYVVAYVESEEAITPKLIDQIVDVAHEAVPSAQVVNLTLSNPKTDGIFDMSEGAKPISDRSWEGLAGAPFVFTTAKAE